MDADGERRWLTEVELGYRTRIFGLAREGDGVLVFGDFARDDQGKGPFVLADDGSGETSDPEYLSTGAYAKVEAFAEFEDGGDAVSGTSFSGSAPAHREGWVQRLSPDRSQRDATTFQVEDEDTVAEICLPANDGGAYVVGRTYDGTDAYFATRFDAALDRTWTYRFDHVYPSEVEGCRHPDGGIVIATDQRDGRFTHLTADGDVARGQSSMDRTVTAMEAGPDGTILFAENRWRGSTYKPGLGRLGPKRDHRFERFEIEGLKRLTDLHVETGGDLTAVGHGWHSDAGVQVSLLRFRNPAPDPDVEVLRPLVAGESTWLKATNANGKPRGHLDYTWYHQGEVVGEQEHLHPTFETPGEHEVTLEIVDEFGKSGSVTKTLRVDAPETPTPTPTVTPPGSTDPPTEGGLTTGARGFLGSASGAPSPG